MNIVSNPQRLSSFDHSITSQSGVFRPDRYRVWDKIDKNFNKHLIARGAGLSYVAASFGNNSLVTDMRQFNRVLEFDSERGQIHLEAGTSLGKTFRILSHSGFFLPTQPGHPSITIGGCIGADVHGKNQSADGNFSEQVESLTLYHPHHGLIELSNEQNPELFELTMGGYGLTGIIVKAKLRTKKLISKTLEVETQEISSIEDLHGRFTETEKDVDLLYSWHDFHSKTSSLGFIKTGRFIANSQDLYTDESFKPLGSDRALPFNCFNRLSMKLVNAYFFRQELSQTRQRVPLFDFLFPVAKKTIYFKLFGKTGFFESQTLLPPDQFPAYIDELRSYLRKESHTITLASGKLFRGHQKLLRFNGTGMCFAINTPRNPSGMRLMKKLNELCLKHSGIPNLVKNSTLDRETVERCYPEFDKFRTLLREFDPKLVFRSELSDRLEL